MDEEVGENFNIQVIDILDSANQTPSGLGERSGPSLLSTDASSGPPVALFQVTARGTPRMALPGCGQLTSLSFLFHSTSTCKRLFEGYCFSGLPRGVLSIDVQGTWFLLSNF